MINCVQRQLNNDCDVALLSNQSGLSKDIIRVLCARGIDTLDKIQVFLSEDADALTTVNDIPYIMESVKFINDCVTSGKRILIYGDYDCDGICSIALFNEYFKSINYSISYYVPLREKDGYGLSLSSIEYVIKTFNPNVIITVDCGISNVIEITELVEKYGIEVMVTDHHEPPQVLPNCRIVNPKVYNDNKLYDLSGAGVVYKIIEGLAGRDFALSLVDIAGISTIADLVPLVGENRLIVKLAIKQMSNSPRAGIKQLLAKAGQKDKITATDIAFKIAPRINAVGRMGNANQVVTLFEMTDYFNIQCLIDTMEEANMSRKKLCEDIYQDALVELKSYDLVNNRIIILYKENWALGVLGIVAARLSGEFNRPTLLMSSTGDNIWKGSARSIRDVSIYDILNAFKGEFMSFGGHSGAAGVKLQSKWISPLIEHCNDYIIKHYIKALFLPSIVYDLILDSDKCEFDFLNQLDKLEPYGISNDKPVFLFQSDNQVMNIMATNHIKGKLNKQVDIIGFSMAKLRDIFAGKTKSSVSISRNIFNNQENIQAIIKQSYLEDIKDIPQDKYFLEYLKSMLLRSSTNKVTYIDNYGECLDKANELYGTLLVCYNPKTFNYIKDIILKLPKYKKLNFLLTLGDTNSKNPYNMLILAPNANFEYDYYSQVIILDTPINNTIVTNKEIYILDDNYSYEDIIKNLNIDREKCIQVYKDIKQVASKYYLYNSIDTLYDYLIKDELQPYNKIDFSLIFYILYELGLFTVKDGMRLHFDITKKCNLEDSKLYIYINK